MSGLGRLNLRSKSTTRENHHLAGVFWDRRFGGPAPLILVTVIRGLVIGVGCAGCGADAPPAPVPELVRAIDINPDPAIVEVALVATEANVEYETGTTTQVLAYRDANADVPASVPGPTIEAKVGDRLIVHFKNELATRETTIHWHGLRLPIEMDGDPAVSGAVPPGGTFEYDFVLRDAGLYWYHPHVETDEQIELGLQGALLVRDRVEPTIAIERTFLIDDIDLADDGELRLEPSHEDLVLGRRGAALLVNGKAPGSIHAAAGSVERWRIANTSNGRFFDLRLDGLPLRVIGWDGGLIPAPYDVDHLVVAPGERYDLAVALDRSSGVTVALQTLEIARGHSGVDRGPLDLVTVVLDGEPRERDVLPTVGPTLARLPVTAQTTTRRFVLTEQLEGPAGTIFFINNQRWPLNTALPVNQGDVEIWEIVNDAEAEHPVHVHGHFFELLDRDGAPEMRQGLKDTVVLGAKSTIRAALRYDEPGKWMFHCQIPEHAERGMTADVNVVP